MYNFREMSGEICDLSWLSRRYNAMLFGFPDEIRPETLVNDDVCLGYDSNEAYDALKLAHKLLTAIARDMLDLPEINEEGVPVVEKSLYKTALLWVVGFCGGIFHVGNEYCLTFKKPLRSKDAQFPANYAQTLLDINENGCWVEYFKNDKSAADYKSCNNGIIHFNDGLTALGIHLFAQKCAGKNWYLNYVHLDDPVKHHAGPFHRTDMRIFICGGEPEFNAHELLGGYSDAMKGYFMKVCDFMKSRHPEYYPKTYNPYGPVSGGIGFESEDGRNFLAGITMGDGEDYYNFLPKLTGASGKLKKALTEELGKDYKDCWLRITNEADADYAIKIMDIKAKCFAESE